MVVKKIIEKLKCPADAEKCPHWGKVTKYPRKCYYEPQCWRGVIFGIKEGRR